MSKRLIQLLIFLLTPLLIVVGFSSWIIVGEKSETVGTTPSVAVCYNSITGTEYTRIEKALEDAISGQTVYVIPNLKNDNGTSLEIKIFKDCIIKTGVTLCLPYTETTYYDKNNWGTLTNSFSDANDDLVNQYRKTLVVISSGVQMTIESGAKLLIGGMFGTKNTLYTGHVNGDYCEISLEQKAKIVSSGNIECYGFIKEKDSLNNESMLEIVRGTMKLPFIIYDYKGGTDTNSMNSEGVCPFDIYDIANIQCLFRIRSSSVVSAEYRLYVGTGDVMISNNVNFVSSFSSNTALVLKSGYLDIKYTPSNIGHTDLKEVVIGQTKMFINGNLSLGSIQLSLTIKLSIIATTVNINTEEFYFPIPYKYQIIVTSGSVLTTEYDVKFLPGSSVLVENGGKCQVSANVAFYPSWSPDELTINSDIGDAYRYPMNLQAARIVNEGYLLVDSKGCLVGDVISTKANAVLDIKNSTVELSIKLAGESCTDVKTIKLKGIITGQVDFSELSQNVYVSQNDRLYTWKVSTDVVFTIRFHKAYFNSNNMFDYADPNFFGSASLPITDEIELSTILESPYNYVGWYFDSNCVGKIVKNIAYGSQMLYYDEDKDNIIDIYVKFTLAPLVNVKYIGTVNNNQFNSIEEFYTENVVVGETFTLTEGYSDYCYSILDSNTKLIKSTFKNWTVKLKYKIDNYEYIESYSVGAGDDFIIPQGDYSDGYINITPEFDDKEYYSVTIKGSNTKYISVQGLEEIAGLKWASPLDSITVTVEGYTQYFVISKKVTCTISGTTMIKSDGTSTNSISASGAGNTTSAEFIMPENSVTLTGS